MKTAKPFRIRKQGPSQMPRRTSVSKSQPSKWDDSYVVEPIPLYNALNDIHWKTVKQGLKKKVSERYSFKSTDSSASSLKTRREPLFARDDDIKKAKLELKNAWHTHRIPVYYQQLFEDWVFNLVKQKALVLILLETSRLDEGTASIQNCMIVIKARENSLVNLRRLEPNLRETRDYPGFIQVKTRTEYEQCIARTIDAVNCIVNWRNELASARKQSGKKERKIVFRFNNQNYLIKMLKDRDFLKSREYIPIVSIPLPQALTRKLTHAEVIMEQEALLHQQQSSRPGSAVKRIPPLAATSITMDNSERRAWNPEMKEISGLQAKYANKLHSHSARALAASISEKLIEKQMEEIVHEIEIGEISRETVLNRVTLKTYDSILMSYVNEVARKTLYKKLKIPKTLPKIKKPKISHPEYDPPTDSEKSPRKFYFAPQSTHLPPSMALQRKQKEISTEGSMSPKEIQKAPDLEIRMSPRASTSPETMRREIEPAFEVIKQIISAQDLLNASDINRQIFGTLLEKILEDLIGDTVKYYEKETQQENVLAEQIWNTMIETCITDVIFIPQMDKEQERIKQEKLKKQAAVAEEIFDSMLETLTHNLVKVIISMMHDDIARKIFDEIVIEVIPDLVAQPSMEDERKAKVQREEDERKAKVQWEEDERKANEQREEEERKAKAQRDEEERKAKTQREEAAKGVFITGIFDSLIGKILSELVVSPQIEEEKLAIESEKSAKETIVTDIFDSLIGKLLPELVALPQIEEKKLILQKEKEVNEAITMDTFDSMIGKLLPELVAQPQIEEEKQFLSSAQAAQDAIVLDTYESMIAKLVPELVVLPSIEKVKRIVKYEKVANEKISENMFDQMLEKLLPDIVIVPTVDKEKFAELLKSFEGTMCANIMEDLLTIIIQDTIVMPCVQAELEEMEKQKQESALAEQAAKLEQDIAEQTADGQIEALILEFCAEAYDHEVSEIQEIAKDIFDGMITGKIVDEACEEAYETEQQQALQMKDYLEQVIADDLINTAIDDLLELLCSERDRQKKESLKKDEISTFNPAPDDWYKTNPDYTTSFTPVNVHHLSIEELYRQYRDTLPQIMKNISVNAKALISIANSGINTEWYWITEDRGRSFGLLVYTHELSRDGTRKSVVLHFTTIKLDVYEDTARKLIPHFRDVDKWVELRLYINYALDPDGDLFLEYDIKEMLTEAGLRWKSSSDEIEGVRKVEIMGQTWQQNQKTFATHFDIEVVSSAKLESTQKFDGSSTDVMRKSGCRMNTIYLLMPYACCPMDKPNNKMQNDMDERFGVLSQLDELHDDNFYRITDTCSKLKINDFYTSGNSVLEKGVAHLAIVPPHFTAIPLANNQMVYFIPTQDPDMDLFFLTIDLEKLKSNLKQRNTDLFHEAGLLLSNPSDDPGETIRQLWIPSFKASIQGRVPWLDGFDLGEQNYVTEYSETVSIRHSVEDPTPGLLKYAQFQKIIEPPFIFGGRDHTIYSKFEMPLFVTLVKEIGL